MDASKLPKLQSIEINSDGRPVNLPGIYKNKDNPDIPDFITSEGHEGILMADFLMNPIWKDAWERIGDVPSRLELQKMRKAQEVKDATQEALQAGREAEELKAAKKKALEEAKVAN